ncbi:hypothetical protein HDV00_008885 [Rhizophlyctis rosea]|nr:hypothetical protein HDV00_008885 [Rhizophlyctis rosea]
MPANFDVEDVLSKLTLAEKVSLLAGHDFWHTVPIPRLGVPSIRVSDGPNGIRGTKFFAGVPAAAIPCATALGSTFNTSLISDAGKLLAEEMKAKAVHVILAPTVNIQRSPLGGRGFESYSEDPVLSGKIAAAYVKGIQDEGLGACIKHFVCNDQEHERMKGSSEVQPRALHEIYLKPFEIVQRDSKPWAYMTSYGRLNGRHCSETPELLQGLLRDTWGFDGLVMSDWFGTYSVSDAVNAGLDLEMPGPPIWRGEALTKAIVAGKITPATLDERVRAILKFVKRTAGSGIPDGAEETGSDREEHRACNRSVAAESIVLVKNETNLLPLKKESLKGKKVAVIGPNAKNSSVTGGGSASLLPYRVVSAFEALKETVEQAGGSVEFEVGCYAHKMSPVLNGQIKTPSGQNGFQIDFYKADPFTSQSAQAAATVITPDSNNLFDVPEGISPTNFWAKGTALYVPPKTATYTFGLTVAGRAKLFVNDQLVVSNCDNQTAGDSFFSNGTIEELGEIQLEQGKQYTLRVEFENKFLLPPPDGVAPLRSGGFRVGCCEKLDEETALAQAEKLAKESDIVVLVAGLNGDWESEGWDRKSMDLPGRTVDLITRVQAANPSTIVVLQTGTPVSLPFLPSTSTVLQAWYGGNEGGHAIADVIFGEVAPSGRMSLSWSKRLEDNPSFINWGCENGKVYYGEGVFVGYRWYEEIKREVEIAFGEGGSYTTFEYLDIKVEGTAGKDLAVSVTVKNTGSIASKDVVQVYLRHLQTPLRTPQKGLVAFQKTEVIKPGSSVTVTLPVEKASFGVWDDSLDSWRMFKGKYELVVSRSSAEKDVKGRVGVEIGEELRWRGL